MGVLEPMQGTGKTKTRGLSLGIEETAVARKLTDAFGDLPEYQIVKMADQAKKASDFLASDPQGALDVAMGREQPPRGIYPESVLVAVENAALARGDAETLRALATNSALSPEATTMGQRIRILGERDQSSPVGAIKAVKEAREENVRNRGVDPKKEKTRTKRQLKAVSRKSRNSTRQSWEEFIHEITC